MSPYNHDNVFPLSMATSMFRLSLERPWFVRPDINTDALVIPGRTNQARFKTIPLLLFLKHSVSLSCHIHGQEPNQIVQTVSSPTGLNSNNNVQRSLTNSNFKPHFLLVNIHGIPKTTRG